MKVRWSVYEMVLCGLFAALIGVGAYLKISIPVEPFPMHFTLQWFFVLLAGFLLGARSGGIATCIYLAIGLAGVPIFAAGGGISYVLRPTFGFLLGFAIAAWAIGFWSERTNGKWHQLLVASVIGLLVYYGCGMVYFYFMSRIALGTPVSWWVVLVNCCLITIGEDFVLCVLAVLVAVRMRPMVYRLRMR